MINLGRLSLILLTSIVSVFSLQAQMKNGSTTLYGNEWLHDGQQYYKFQINTDGYYRVDLSALRAAGFDTGITGADLRLYRNGVQIPIETSNEGLWTEGDFLRFVGSKNKSELDTYLYPNGQSDIVNTDASLYSDNANYFLTLENSSTALRTRIIPNDQVNLPTQTEIVRINKKLSWADRINRVYEYVASGRTYDALSDSKFFGGKGMTVDLPNKTVNFIVDDLAQVNGEMPIISYRGATNIGDFLLRLGHNITIHLNGNLIDSVVRSFPDQIYINRTFKDKNQLISQGENSITINGSYATDDLYLGQVMITYPSNTISKGAAAVQFELLDPENNTYLDFITSDVTLANPCIMDSVGNWRINGVIDGNHVKFNIPAAFAKGRLFFYPVVSDVTGNQGKRVILNDFKNINGNYIIISNKKFISDPLDPIGQYKAYRESAIGGNYRVQVVDIDELYNSFIYGNDYNPLAIKNFINYLSIANPDKTRLFYLLGHGRAYNELRFGDELQTAISQGLTLPTMGDIGSDNMLASSLFDRIDMVAGIGRLPILESKEILTYLNKVKSRDLAYIPTGKSEDNTWMKNVIQLNGGKVGEQDQVQIENSQLQAAQIFTNNKFAGFNTIFKKNTSDPIGTLSAAYYEKVNEGASIVDYFGHGTTIRLEIPVEQPGSYKNNPRLPILFIKGCKAGNIHQIFNTLPGNVLYNTGFEKDGFAAVIGSAGDALISSLALISYNFYNHLGGDMYGQPLGLIVSKSVSNPNINWRHEAFQQTYAGDPALIISPLEGPDYTIDRKSVKVTPEILSSKDEEFSINFTILNIGSKMSDDTLNYVLYYKNDKNQIIDSLANRIINPASSEKVTATFSLNKNAGAVSRVHIILDPKNNVAEHILPMAEMNNEYLDDNGKPGVPIYLKTSQLFCVYPAAYAIVDSNRVILNGFSNEINYGDYSYHFSMDTTDQFNSPLLITNTIIGKPGHLEYSPDIILEPGVVYFWRISRDSISPLEPASVAISSFTYYPGENGFAQLHNGQFRQNQNTRLSIEGPGNHIEFGKRPFYFNYTNGLTTPENWDNLGGYREDKIINAMKANRYLYFYKEGALALFWYKRDSLFYAFQPGFTGYGSSDVENYTGVKYYLFYESGNRASRIALVNMIEQTMAPDDIFMLTTINDAEFPDLHTEQWAEDSLYNNGKNIFNVLEKYGARFVRNISTQAVPYSIIVDKKDGVIDEQLSYEKEFHVVEATIIADSHSGATEQVFGPAAAWDKFELIKRDSIRKNDVVEIKLTAQHAFDPSLNVEFNYKMDAFNNHFIQDLSAIDAATYPYIKMRLTFIDGLYSDYNAKFDGIVRLKFSSTQLPEAAILAEGKLSQDTLTQGKSVHLMVGAKNIGKLQMDSMLVAYTFNYGANNSEKTLKRYGVLKKAETDHYSIDLDTRNVSGITKLIIDLNPDNDQPELSHVNNLIIQNIYVQTDKENPLVDVTFDGDHILDGDIVSSKPFIKINVRDENKYFALDDSSLFELIITDPADSVSTIKMNDPNVRFIPADKDNLGTENVAMIEYRPTFTIEGDYKIEVKARDRSGNNSGQYDYTRAFKVILKKTVSDLFNYPNPFSNATRFVYTLTGNEMPTTYKIQIMSVSGKIVREITQAEIGPLKIGKHMTDYVWNGTDQYGDKLANGVYLYRLVMKDQNKKVYDKFNLDASTDVYFDGGWSKLVIIR